MEEKKSTKGCSPPKKGGAARTGPLWERSDTSQHFTPTPFLVGAGAITSSHRLLLMIIDNYQHYHTNGKMGAWLPQSTAHVAVHRATSLSLSCLPVAMPLQGFPWFVFLGRGVIFWREKRSQRDQSHSAASQLCPKASQDTGSSPSCLFPNEAEVRSQSMNTHKGEHKH